VSGWQSPGNFWPGVRLTLSGVGCAVDNAVTEQAQGGIQTTPDEKRPVTLFSAAIIVIANMIGIGVFTTLGFQVASLHSPFSVLMLWVLGGLGAFCGALCYGELGSMMPRRVHLSLPYLPSRHRLSFGLGLHGGRICGSHRSGGHRFR